MTKYNNAVTVANDNDYYYIISSNNFDLNHSPHIITFHELLMIFK